MVVDLASPSLLSAAAERLWNKPEIYWPLLTEATADRSAPVVALCIEALAHNAHDMLRRANGTSLRVASKSVRVREILEAVLALPGYHGVLAYTLAEAVWLSDYFDDVVVAYPSADAAAFKLLAKNGLAAGRIAVMIDSVEQLDFIDGVAGPRQRASIRVCLDFDASWNSRLLGSVGALRSPVRDVAALRRLAERVAQRPGFEVVGVMSYEAQIAGVGDQQEGRPITSALMRSVQRMSAAELADRRAAAIAEVRQVADLQFVNGGGTGSIESTADEAAITEVAVGSGLFGPHLFDHYRMFSPAPAVAIALDVVRKPNAKTATLLGGGWIASGVPGLDRLPEVVWPPGLKYSSREGAGEVQTPLSGAAAQQVGVGSRVWARHTKSGEPMEHTNELVPVSVSSSDGGGPTNLAPMLTYRGEGKCFL